MENTPQRQIILDRIRTSLHRSKGEAPTIRQYGFETVPARARGSAPQLIRRFEAEAKAVSATVGEIELFQDLPREVGRYLATERLPPIVRIAPDPRLTRLSWLKPCAITVTAGLSNGNDDVGLTIASAGVAETGTLVLHSGTLNPISLNFLPATLIVVLHIDQIVGAYEEALESLCVTDDLPSTINFVTGPSRTADIEQQLELGAHGPRRLHIVLVKSSSYILQDSDDR